MAFYGRLTNAAEENRRLRKVRRDSPPHNCDRCRTITTIAVTCGDWGTLYACSQACLEALITHLDDRIIAMAYHDGWERDYGDDDPPDDDDCYGRCECGHLAEYYDIHHAGVAWCHECFCELDKS